MADSPRLPRPYWLLMETSCLSDDIYMLEGVVWVRKRQLASDARAGRFARSKARRLQYEYARHHWRLLLAGWAAVLLFGSAVLVPLHAGFPRGFFAGGLVAVATGLV